MTPWKRLLLTIGLLQFALATPAGAQKSPQENLWKSSMAAGTAAFRQRNFPEAEKQYKAAVVEAEKFGPNDQRLATSLQNLGTVYFLELKITEAEPVLKRALGIKEAALGLEDPLLLGTLDNLTRVYSVLMKLEAAEEYCQRALAIREKTLGPEHLDVADNLDTLADLYRMSRSKSKDIMADQYYSKPAPGVVVDSGGDRAGRRTPQPYELGLSGPPKREFVSRRDIEEERLKKENAARAEPLFKRAASIREKALGAEHPKHILSLVNLTICYANQGKKAEAEATAQRMWEILQKAPEQPPVVLEQAASAMRAVGREQEAEKLEAKAKAKAK